ncbi:MAG: YjcZ family sporulation protein [Gemmatimonadota bacterium]
MQDNMSGYMGGYGLWTILGVLLAIFLVVAIVRMVQKK